MSDSNKDTLTDEEIEVYSLEYRLLADKGRNIRVFLDQKGLTNKGESYHSYTAMPPKAQQLFNILFDIKHEVPNRSK